MKINLRYSMTGLLTLATVGALACGCHQADDQKIGADVKTTAQDTASAAKDLYNNGKDKAVELATNVSALAKEGAHKVSSAATNVAADVKSAATNVAGKVDQMVH